MIISRINSTGPDKKENANYNQRHMILKKHLIEENDHVQRRERLMSAACCIQ